LSGAALAELTGYGWPGNIRELGNVIQRAMILAPDAEIRPEHLMLPKSTTRVAAGSGQGFNGLPGDVGLKDVERETILGTLKRMDGSRRKNGGSAQHERTDLAAQAQAVS
jgi:DNA-binding NtrC family response regulator